MSLWHCTDCSTRYAVGLAACPHCGATGFTENGVPLPPKAWTCQNTDCGAQYALQLFNCPRCAGTRFELEDTVPKITKTSGASNGQAEPEPAAAPAVVAAEPTPAGKRTRQRRKDADGMGADLTITAEAAVTRGDS